MLSELDRIRLLAILYGSPDPAGAAGSPLPQWTTIVQSVLGPVGHIRTEGADELFWPGSRTALDWWIDFDAVPLDTGALGKVHAGFLSKPSLLYGRLNALCGPVVRANGHSLGSADAEVYSGLRVAHGLPVAEIVAFGSPMPGCQEMKTLIAQVPMRNYRNQLAPGGPVERDPIPGYPFPIPIEFPCLQMRDFIPVVGAPAPGDDGDFRLHHAAQYWAGLVNQAKR